MQEISITEDLPAEFRAILLGLVQQHPSLGKLSVTTRKGCWGIYSSHPAIVKALDGKQRTPKALVEYFKKWLAQSTQAPIIELLPEAAAVDPSIWATSMLENHIDLSELTAEEQGGVITITAFDE